MTTDVSGRLVLLAGLLAVCCGRSENKPSPIPAVLPRTQTAPVAKPPVERLLTKIPGSKGWTVTLKTKRGFNTGIAEDLHPV